MNHFRRNNPDWLLTLTSAMLDARRHGLHRFDGKQTLPPTKLALGMRA